MTAALRFFRILQKYMWSFKCLRTEQYATSLLPRKSCAPDHRFSTSYYNPQFSTDSRYTCMGFIKIIKLIVIVVGYAREYMVFSTSRVRSKRFRSFSRYAHFIRSPRVVSVVACCWCVLVPIIIIYRIVFIYLFFISEPINAHTHSLPTDLSVRPRYLTYIRIRLLFSTYY